MALKIVNLGSAYKEITGANEVEFAKNLADAQAEGWETQPGTVPFVRTSDGQWVQMVFAP